MILSGIYSSLANLHYQSEDLHFRVLIQAAFYVPIYLVDKS